MTQVLLHCADGSVQRRRDRCVSDITQSAPNRLPISELKHRTSRDSEHLPPSHTPNRDRGTVKVFCTSSSRFAFGANLPGRSRLKLTFVG